MQIDYVQTPRDYASAKTFYALGDRNNCNLGGLDLQYNYFFRYTLLSVLELIIGMGLFLYVFDSYIPEHRCLVPTCDTKEYTSNASWIEYAIPAVTNVGEDGLLAEAKKMDKCRMNKIKDQAGSCDMNNFNASHPVTCDAFIYDTSVFPRTVSTDMDLVCANKPKHKLLQTLMMLGLLFGSFLGGWASDFFGRKTSLFAAILVFGTILIVNGFAQNYTMYAALHFLFCLDLPVLWVTNQTLSLEIFSSEYKKFLLCSKTFMWTVGHMLTVLLVYLVRDWTYTHVTAGVMGLACLAAYPFTPESPRWLVKNGEGGAARNLLLKMADENGRVLTDNDIKQIDSLLASEEAADKKETKECVSFLELFRKHFILTTVILIASWVMGNVGFYTLSLNATKLSGDLFVNYAFTFGIQLLMGPFLWLTVSKCGRKFILAALQITVGVCSITLAFIPKDLKVPILIIFLIGNFACSASFNLCWFLSPDYYPTNLRSQATGICSTVARVFGLIVPYISGLAVYWAPMPMFLLGLPFLVISACVIMFLPEVTNCQLPQTTEEAIELHKKRGWKN